MGCADPPSKGVGAPHQCSRVNEKTKWLGESSLASASKFLVGICGEPKWGDEKEKEKARARSVRIYRAWGPHCGTPLPGRESREHPPYHNPGLATSLDNPAHSYPTNTHSIKHTHAHAQAPSHARATIQLHPRTLI